MEACADCGVMRHRIHDDGRCWDCHQSHQKRLREEQEYRDSIESYKVDRKGLLKEVIRDELKRVVRMQVREALRTGQWTGDMACVHPDDRRMLELGVELDNARQERVAKRLEAKAHDQWFVTFNPPSRHEPKVLWESVVTCLKKAKKTITAYHAVIEQRSEDPDFPQGWHMHVCVQLRDKKSSAEVRNMFKTPVNVLWDEGEQSNSMFDTHWFQRLHLKTYHKKYVSGEKREEKMARVQADKIAREVRGFPEFASSGEIIFPGGAIDDGLAEDGSEGSEV